MSLFMLMPLIGSMRVLPWSMLCCTSALRAHALGPKGNSEASQRPLQAPAVWDMGISSSLKCPSKPQVGTRLSTLLAELFLALSLALS